MIFELDWNFFDLLEERPYLGVVIDIEDGFLKLYGALTGMLETDAKWFNRFVCAIKAY